MKESKVQEVATKELVEVSTKSKMSVIRAALKEFTAGLDVEAEMAGRPGVKANDLLREAYGLKEGAKLHTFEGWKRRGGNVRKGEKALPFWGKPREGQSFCPVVFLFAASQVRFSRRAQA